MKAGSIYVQGGVVFALICAACAGIVFGNKDCGHDPTRTLAADQIAAAYDESELKGDALTDGQPAKIRGIVKSITTVFGTHVAKLKGTAKTDIEISFSKNIPASQIATVQVGDEVLVRCQKVDQGIFGVRTRECVGAGE